MDWRVTHMDCQRRRHCTVLTAATGAQAAELALAMYGEALYLSTLRLRSTDRLPVRPLFRPVPVEHQPRPHGAARRAGR
jgi:hypothetical protein